MIIYRKRTGGLEVDYLVFSLKRFMFWLTKSKFVDRLPRIVIWKFSKNPNVGTEKSWALKLR